MATGIEVSASAFDDLMICYSGLFASFSLTLLFSHNAMFHTAVVLSVCLW